MTARQHATGEAAQAGVIVGLAILIAMVVLIYIGSRITA